MAISFGGLLVALGLAVLVHTSVAAIRCGLPNMLCLVHHSMHHQAPCVPPCVTQASMHADRELLKLLQEEFVSLPVALLAEVLVGFAVATAGQGGVGSMHGQLSVWQKQNPLSWLVSSTLQCVVSLMQCAGAYLLAGSLRAITASKQSRWVFTFLSCWHPMKGSASQTTIMRFVPPPPSSCCTCMDNRWGRQ